jgi:hypothetical protein
LAAELANRIAPEASATKIAAGAASKTARMTSRWRSKPKSPGRLLLLSPPLMKKTFPKHLK